MEPCKICGKIHGQRRDLGIRVETEELRLLELVRQQFNCVDQDFSIRNIPEDTPQPLVNKYVNALVTKKAELHVAESAWWKAAIEKYGLTGEVHIDFETGELYIFEEVE